MMEAGYYVGVGLAAGLSLGVIIGFAVAGWFAAGLREDREIRRGRPMTEEERKHFDAAFSHMDKAFDEIRKI